MGYKDLQTRHGCNALQTFHSCCTRTLPFTPHRGCPAQCTFCLWPQTLSGHAWRKRSTDDVAAELAWAKENFSEVKEFFFDDDTFNIQKARTIELCEKLKPLNLTWSCTSRRSRLITTR